METFQKHLKFYNWLKCSQYSKQQSPAVSQARPQALNYEPIFKQNSQPRKPAIFSQQYQQPQSYQYDYEDEITTTKRPEQLQQSPKYSAPAYQFTSSPAPPLSQPFTNSIDIIYADPRQVQSANVKPQHLGDRRPPQFPQQYEPIPTTVARADEFSLFSPAESRDDIYKPKVRFLYSFSHAHKRRKKRKNVFIVLRKKRTFVF